MKFLSQEDAKQKRKELQSRLTHIKSLEAKENFVHSVEEYKSDTEESSSTFEERLATYIKEMENKLCQR